MKSVYRSGRSSYRRLVAALVIAAVLFPASPAPASFSANLGWFYKTCHGSFADGMGSIFFLPTAVSIVFACGVLLLPGDIAYEIAHPETKFGHYAETICVYPAGGGGAVSYALFGAPFFALQWLLWDAYLEPCPKGWREGAKQPEARPAEQE